MGRDGMVRVLAILSLSGLSYGHAATVHDWTVDLLDALPDDGQRYEIIDGELFVTPGPGEPHQDIMGELNARLREYLRGRGVGKSPFVLDLPEFFAEAFE